MPKVSPRGQSPGEHAKRGRMRGLFSPPNEEDLIHLLKAWRFWFVGAVAGALLGASAFYVAPPPYRARATVNVDFHLESAWPQNTDREQFYYLERETRKLVDLAGSDATFAAVASQLPGVTVHELRAGKVQLSQPGNGSWHFYASDAEPGRAAALASAWAEAFTNVARAQVVAGSSDGLEPFITLIPTQSSNLPSTRFPSLAGYVAIGALVVLAAGAFGFLFLLPRR
jgi:hypothetical protein